MADRYLRNTGNFNGPVWASTSNGVAGSAATPTGADNVYIAANYTVTLTADAACLSMFHTNGTLSLSSYTLTSGDGFGGSGFNSTGSSARTINMGSGKLDIKLGASMGDGITLSGTNLTLNAGSSLLQISMRAFSRTFTTLGKVFNDVLIDMGSASNSTTLNISGSATFRSLAIQSKNSAAHTVDFDGDAFITDKFIAIGASSSNRLTLTESTGRLIRFAPTATSYGQFVNADIQATNYAATGNPDIPPYIGSNSTDYSTSSWLLQDPPSASTLITEFNSLSGWQTQVVGSAYVNVSGSALNMGWFGGSAYARATTIDSYNLVNNTIYVKVKSSTGELFMNVVPVAVQGETTTILGTQLLASSERYWRITSTVSGDNATLTMAWFNSGTWVQTYSKVVPSVQLRSVKFQISGTRNLSAAALVVDSVGVGPFPTQPIADFSATPTTGKRPVTVQFTDITTGIPDTWSWNFGDGYSSTQQNPSHPYSKAGTYTVALTASNSIGTDTVTKTSLVVISPEIFTTEAKGTLVLGGGTSRKLSAQRSAGGTLVFGGDTRIVLIRDAEIIQDKTYLHKVYNPDGSFIEVWKDVIGEPEFTNEINSIGSSMTVELARNSDSVGVTSEPLLTDDNDIITTDDNLPLLASVETRNQIGAGSSVDYNNRVDILAFYGAIEPLYTDDMDEILTDDDEPILAEEGAPNGRRIFTGFISEINSRYGNSETTVVQLTSFGYDLDQYPITTAYNNNVTTVAFNSQDPSDIARTAIDRFVQTSSLEQVTYTMRTIGSISSTGNVVSYTFRNNTYKEVLDKVLELMPSNWYYRVGLGDNTVYFRERSTEADHILYLGKHIKALDLKGSILGTVNHTLFTGGGDPALYVENKETPAPRTRRGLNVMSDSRVTLEDSANIISQGKIEENNKMQSRSTVEVLTKQYDIETFEVGDTVGFRNFNNDVDSKILQIVGRSYSADVVQLQLESKPPTINKRLEDVIRNLTVTENNNLPSTPL